MMDLFTDERAQGRMSLTAVAITLVVAGTVGFIGILVMSEVISTASLDAGGPNTTADPLYNASQGLQDSVDSAWGLFGVAFIVVILSAIVFYLYRVQGGGMGGGGRV